MKVRGLMAWLAERDPDAEVFCLCYSHAEGHEQLPLSTGDDMLRDALDRTAVFIGESYDWLPREDDGATAYETAEAAIRRDDGIPESAQRPWTTDKARAVALRILGRCKDAGAPAPTVRQGDGEIEMERGDTQAYVDHHGGVVVDVGHHAAVGRTEDAAVAALCAEGEA